jgi:RNA recognition motif-containing protein
MSVRLFVGNLPYDATDAELTEFLSPVGKPLSVRILIDRETGKPRGFGFVEFSDAAQADEAVRRFHQQLFKGRPLVINEARPREDGAGARATPFGQPGRAAEPAATARPGQPTRTFGPDAAPRGTRKRSGRGAKGERTPKRPIPERTGGQFFAGGVEDSPDDQAADDVAFWDRAAADDQDET